MTGARLDLVLVLALTFTTGVVDAVGYLGLDNVFTANMTGNVIVLGMGLAGAPGLPVLGPAVALAGFVVGAALGGRLLRTAADSGKTVRELLADVPDFVSTPEIRIDVEEEEKFGIVEKAVAHFRSTHDVIDVDGVRVLFGDGWGLIRASNTQPVLVARFEARSEERLVAIRGEMEGWLRSQGVRV